MLCLRTPAMDWFHRSNCPLPTQVEQGSSERGRLRKGRLLFFFFFWKQIEEIAALCVDNLGEETWRSVLILCRMSTIFLSHFFALILKIFKPQIFCLVVLCCSILLISLLKRHGKNTSKGLIQVLITWYSWWREVLWELHWFVFLRYFFLLGIYF